MIRPRGPFFPPSLHDYYVMASLPVISHISHGKLTNYHLIMNYESNVHIQVREERRGVRGNSQRLSMMMGKDLVLSLLGDSISTSG